MTNFIKAVLAIFLFSLSFCAIGQNTAMVENKYSVTINLTDENGKKAIGAEVETFNVNTGSKVLRKTDKKGKLKFNASESEFNTWGSTQIYFRYKDYAIEDRLLKKEFCPIVYTIKLSRKKKEDNEVEISAPPSSGNE